MTAPGKSLVEQAREYLASNAAESGADVLIGELLDLVEQLNKDVDDIVQERLSELNAEGEAFDRAATNALRWILQHKCGDAGAETLDHPDGWNDDVAISVISEVIADAERRADAAERHIERLEREKEEAARENIDMMWQRRRADERAEAAEQLAEERLEHIVALEAELARLKSPMEGAKTTTEERAEVRAWCDGLKYSSAYEGRISGLVSRVLDDLDHATAQARSAADVENELSRVVLGWREHDYPAQFDRWTAQYIAGRYHDARNTIRTRRKGESNG